MSFFQKKKLYRIEYRILMPYNTIIAAKDEFRAIEKLKREVKKKYSWLPTILSIEEISI